MERSKSEGPYLPEIYLNGHYLDESVDYVCRHKNLDLILHKNRQVLKTVLLLIKRQSKKTLIKGNRFRWRIRNCNFFNGPFPEFHIHFTNLPTTEWTPDKQLRSK